MQGASLDLSAAGLLPTYRIDLIPFLFCDAAREAFRERQQRSVRPSLTLPRYATMMPSFFMHFCVAGSSSGSDIQDTEVSASPDSNLSKLKESGLSLSMASLYSGVCSSFLPLQDSVLNCFDVLSSICFSWISILAFLASWILFSSSHQMQSFEGAPRLVAA
jgi:hypothetical protein